MKPFEKILYLILLPIISILIYPPEYLTGGLSVIVFFLVVMIALGILIWRRRSLALTFGIFLQGMNIIIRVMMFFSHAVDTKGIYDFTYIITNFIGLGLSMYLMLHLDSQNMRTKLIG